MQRILATIAFILLSSNHCLLLADNNDTTKYLIIHADDAGMTHSINRGTFDALDNGIVSSASIMVPCPWFKGFVHHFKERDDYDYGIHLTLNSEFRHCRWGTVSNTGDVPSLIDPEGYMWDESHLVARHALAKHVKTELKAQIDRALEYEIPITHLDAHMGSVFSRYDLAKVYVELGIEYDLPVLFIKDFEKKNPNVLGEVFNLEGRGRELEDMLKQHKLPILDDVVFFYEEERPLMRKQLYLKALRKLKPGVTQIIIHCGYDEPELNFLTATASRRDLDRQIFQDPEILKEIILQDIKIITWKQFHEMTKKGEL